MNEPSRIEIPDSDQTNADIEGGVAITVNALDKSYGDNHVLDELTFELERGKVYAVMGPSGCGKSTLLRNLIGAEEPDSGEVLIDGINIHANDRKTRDKARRKFGVLFQSAALLNGLSVADNVALPIQRHTDLPQSTIDLMVKLKLELVGMGNAADKYPYEISGGMKRRCGLARAIALDPAIVFYDEPSAGLDPVMIGVIDKLIKDLTNKLGITSVVITHEMPSIFRIADEALMLFNGKFVFRGSPEELRESDDPMVRQFIEGDPEGPINAPKQLSELSERLIGPQDRGSDS